MPDPLRTELLAWFDRAQRDLPWRKTRDPYAIWVSEVMLQQTQVATVIPYWRRFLARFPTVEALAEAPLDDVLGHWKGLGYYSRARNLHRAAQTLAAAGRAGLPRTAKDLLQLPGFGRYTAGAVASIAFGEEAPIVDGNVARVFSRLFEVEGAPGEKAREARLWQLAEERVCGERPGDWNQALMELGALICLPDNPTCLLCPVRAFCGACRSGRVAELPPKRVRAPRQSLHLGLALWRKESAVLLARRAEKGLFGGLWELPSWPLSKGESAQDAAARAFRKALELGAPLGQVQRTLTHRDLTLTLYPVLRGKPPGKAHYLETRWATPAEAESLGISTAMQKALELAWKSP